MVSSILDIAPAKTASKAAAQSAAADPAALSFGTVLQKLRINKDAAQPKPPMGKKADAPAAKAADEGKSKSHAKDHSAPQAQDSDHPAPEASETADQPTDVAPADDAAEISAAAASAAQSDGALVPEQRLADASQTPEPTLDPALAAAAIAPVMPAAPDAAAPDSTSAQTSADGEQKINPATAAQVPTSGPVATSALKLPQAQKSAQTPSPTTQPSAAASDAPSDIASQAESVPVPADPAPLKPQSPAPLRRQANDATQAASGVVAADIAADKQATAPQAISSDPTAAIAQLLNPTSTAKAAAPQAAAPAPQPAMTPEQRFAQVNHANVVQSIRSQLLPNGGRMQIRLDPPELGALQISVQMQNGQMIASFQTSSDQTASLLSHSLDQLKQSLESQGVSVDKLQVRHAPAAPDRQNDEPSQNPQQRHDAESQQEQQRKQMIRNLWRRLAKQPDALDVTA